MKTIAICGSICVGKTTLIKELSRLLNSAASVTENPSENPFFQKHFGNEGFMFKSQLIFYSDYLKNMASAMHAGKDYLLLDRCINEYLFLSNFRYSIGELTEEETFVCKRLANSIESISPAVDKYIFLYCDLSTAKERICMRGNKWDQNIEEHRLEDLFQAYKNWFYSLTLSEHQKSMTFDTSRGIDLDRILRFIIE